MPPRRRFGGILLRFNCESLEVVNVFLGEFAVKFMCDQKLMVSGGSLVVVYGAAQPEFKPDFLADLVNICQGGELTHFSRWGF